MTELYQHPLSAAFPSMPGHEIDALAADIKANGQREPATMYEDMVLDGWHRYRACQILGLPLGIVQFPKDADPVAFVKSRNLHRRHLSGSQRADAVLACSTWAQRGRPAKSEPGSDLASATEAEMAKEADVSTRTIQQAKVARTAGLGDAVKEGKVTAKRAAEIVKADPKVGKKIAAGKVTADEVIANAKPLPKILPRPEAKVDSKQEAIEVARDHAKKQNAVIRGLRADLAARDAQIESLKGDLAEARDNAAELADSLQSYMKADEGAEAAAKEIKRLMAQVKVIEATRDQYMTQNAEMKRSLAARDRKIAKLEGKP